jgi:DNA repair exonuclease SbcCD ATPase subunit
MTSKTLGLCTVAFAAALALFPIGTAAQQATSQMISAVTEDYSFEMLFPAMSTEGIASTREMAAWYLNASRSYKDRAAEIQKQIDLQREAKKAEIQALEARVKAADKVKDKELKKKLEAAVKEQKMEKDILDSVKKLSENEASIADQYEEAGEALESFAASYETLAKTRESVLEEHAKTIKAATEAGLPASMPPVDYKMNEKALKSLAEAGKKLRELGDRMEKVAKARQELLNHWKKRVEGIEKP